MQPLEDKGKRRRPLNGSFFMVDRSYKMDCVEHVQASDVERFQPGEELVQEQGVNPLDALML